jgi:hypothetical protein
MNFDHSCLKKALWALILTLVLAVLDPAAERAGATADDDWRSRAPRVFLDCPDCDLDFIRSEIDYVNYVRDRTAADVHVLITGQANGSGGTTFSVSFMGQDEFKAINNTLTCHARGNATAQETRQALARTLQLGLTPYIANSPLADMLQVSLDREKSPLPVKDRWNCWVFCINLSGDLDGEKSWQSRFWDISLTANRVTQKNKLRLGVSGEFQREKYQYEGNTIYNTFSSRSFNGLYVKGLGEHWSAGIYAGMNSSSYYNTNLQLSLAPALEYNLFPYARATRRQMRLLYRIGAEISDYREETIYEKTRENLLYQSLTAVLELKEPWGTMEASLLGSHYLKDISLNRLSFKLVFDIRIGKGLAVNLDGRYYRIRDQVSLPRAGASLEDILLKRREIATEYTYNLAVGLTYTFGSIFSNIVNPRFGAE